MKQKTFRRRLEYQTRKLQQLISQQASIEVMKKSHQKMSYVLRCVTCHIKTLRIDAADMKQVHQSANKAGWKPVNKDTAWVCPSCSRKLEKQANSVGLSNIFED